MDNNTQVQNRKTSKLAIASLGLAALSAVSLFCFFPSLHSLSKYSAFFGTVSFLFFFGGAILSIILGISSIIICKSKYQLEGKVWAVGGIILSSIILLYFISILPRIRYSGPRLLCAANLSSLGKAMLVYGLDNDDKFPTPDKWCDLLIEGGYVDSEKQFKCPGNKKARCSYAMNPNCKLDSPADMVLLFETKGGWNQFGGRELLTTCENNKGDVCYILFVDSQVKFESLKGIDKLNWGDEKGEK